jgi:hypothetical protein
MGDMKSRILENAKDCEHFFAGIKSGEIQAKAQFSHTGGAVVLETTPGEFNLLEMRKLDSGILKFKGLASSYGKGKLFYYVREIEQAEKFVSAIHEIQREEASRG